MNNLFYRKYRFYRLIEPLITLFYRTLGCRIFGHLYECLGEEIKIYDGKSDIPIGIGRTDYCSKCVSYKMTKKDGSYFTV